MVDRIIEQGPKLVFRMGSREVPQDFEVDSPEALAEAGIRMSAEFMTKTWGPDAVARYRHARNGDGWTYNGYESLNDAQRSLLERFTQRMPNVGGIRRGGYREPIRTRFDNI